MSSFYDDSSLVLIPSGYKTSKVYAEKPTDGSGDLAFTRTGDTATRVNSAGLIEKVRTNLVLQSQTFDNASWGKIGSTITANATAAPDGTATADSNIESAALAEHGVSQVLAISSGLNTISISVKANSRTRCRIGFANSSYGSMTAAQLFAYFDVSTGTVVQNISGGFSTIVDEGNGWYRCSVSQNLVAGDAAGAVQLLFIDSGINTYYTGNGTSGLFLWGGQLEVGDIATDYIPTTTAAVSVGPVANVPRLDYLGSTCPRLLLEPQRTNLVTNSEQFTAWISAGGTVTSNTAISPDGTQNADTLTGARYQTGFASNQYTVSCFAKKVDGDGLFVLRLDVPTSFSAQFNLNNGTIVSTSAGYTSTITNYGNGWYRCTLTTPAATTISNFVIVSASNAAASTYVWGAQSEIGAYATSYIPTTAASVTRVADAASKTGISSLIGQTEGTVFLDFNLQTTNEDFVIGQIYNSSTPANSIYFYVTSTNVIEAFVDNSGTQARIIPPSASAQGRYKLAIAYKANEFKYYVNGTLIGTDTSGTVPTCNSINLIDYANGGGYMEKSAVNQYLIFKTSLTNAQLAELTTI
jgi:hypothetical protein